MLGNVVLTGTIMKKLILLFIFVFLSSSLFASVTLKPIILLEISGEIGPAMQDYIQKSVEKAHKKNARLIILRLNTSDGWNASTHEINQTILSSSIPIVAYVAPSGAKAKGAGTYILYASHLAAMAPGTNLGPAAPLDMREKAPKDPTTTAKKTTAELTTYIRDLAELRHRNIAIASSFVQENVSLSATRALDTHVINLIAKDIPELLQKLDGLMVETQNAKVLLQTQDAPLENLRPTLRFQFLNIITNPSVAYILLLIGIYGLFFEFASPGFILPGLFGLSAILVALYAFQLLPINYMGFTLLVSGIIAITAEIFISSFGIIGLLGLIAFITGSVKLYDSTLAAYSLPWGIIIVMALATILFFFVMITLTLKSLRKPIITGQEGLIGLEGEVLEYHADYVLIQIQGEIWSAQSTTPLATGQKIRVKKVANLILTVEPV